MNFSDESDELLKQGVSKKQMIEHLRKGDFLDKASWAMLDKQSGGNDDLIFDFFKQNADNLNPRKAQEKQELKNAQDEKQELENELFALQRPAPILPNDSEGQKRRENELKRIAELEQRLAKYTRPFDDAADSELDLKDDEIKKALFEKKDNYLSHQIQTLGQIPDYLESLILDSASIDNEGQAKVETNIRAVFEQAAQRGEKPKLEDFTGQELARLYRKGYANGDLSDKFGDFATNLTGIKRLEFTRHLIEKGYKAFDKETQISQKDLKDLSKSDKEYLKNRDILSNKLLNKAFYDGDKTTIEEQYYQVKGGAMMELASKEAENVKNFHKQYNLLYNGKEWIAKNFKNGEESKEVFNDYFKKLDNIAEKLSFDGAALNHDTGEFEFYKLNEKTGENDFYKLNERFFDNLPEMFKNNLGAVAGSIIGGAIGTITGARKLDAQKVGKGVKRLGVVGSELAGSAIGGGVGASVDYINNAINKGEKIDFETMMYHAAQDSLFSLAFDTAFIGARKLYSKVKEKGLGNVINAAEKAAKNAFSKVGETAMNFSVIGRFAQNAVDGNAPEIRRAIRESISDEQREILAKNSKELGIEADLMPNNTSARAFFVKHFGEDSFLTKGYDLFQQAVYLGGQRDLQKELLSTMRSDSEQILLSYLVETATQSPKRRVNLHKMLNDTSKELINELKSFGLKENEIERVLNRYQKGTEFDFGEAIDNVLKSIYGDDKIYKTTISRENWDKFKTQMLDEHASFGKAIIEPLIEQLEKTLYNPNGVSYKALRDAQEFLNAEFPNLAKQSGKKKYLKAQIRGFIRDDIEKGFNQIFDLNPVVAKDARELFDTAMLDYANMKQIIKEMGENLTQAKTKAGKRKGRQDYENALNKLMDFLTRETPDGQTPFLNKITATMPKEEAERFEIALLDNILKHSRYLVVSGDKKVLDIVNSGEFLRRAGEIKGQFGAKAKDYIDLVSAWHKNFKNDAVLAHLTRNPASEPKVSTGLNPSLEARLKYVATATMFDGFFRLVPRIPFITDKFIGNDKIQAAALRYYLKKTLNESPSISALRRKLNFDLDKGNLPLNSQTRERLRQITNEVQKSEAQMDELAEKIINDLPTKSTLSEPLSVNEIKQNIEKWDLTNPNPQDKILISKVQGAELEQLKSEFDFKGNYALAREIEAKNVKHALTRHGDEAVENARGQIAITKDDIADYEKYTQKPDLRVVQDNNRILYAKQVNGYYVVIEEVLSGQNKLQFFDMWKGKGKINKEVLLSHSQRPKNASEPNFSRRMPSSDEIIPNSNSQSQAPQKSLLEQARENTERLRAEQEAAQIAQKEAELARLKEMQAKNAEILAQKEAAAGQAINEAQSLEIGTPIKAHKISDTKIIINDNTAPFKAEFIIAKKDDIKPNFERTGTQGRSERQDKVIESIQSDFKPHLIFEQMGGFEGLPIILKDGQVIAGNHRAQAIKGLTGENLARYKQAAKEKFGIDLKDDEVIVRLVKDGDEKELINLAFMSNVGRESNIGEKALASLAKYESNMQNLPNHINADSVFELESQVAKALDTQGNGLNVFDTNLALFSRLAKNSSNTDILESLNTLKSLSQDEKEKVLRMFVSNAGEFHNLAKDTQLKSLNLNDYLADALIIAAKNVDEKTRKANFQSLFSDIQTMLASAKEMLKIDPFLFENFKSKALGYALARFARLENPAGKLFDFLKASKGEMENLYTGGLFDTNKAISDIDIYDFLKHAINSGDDLMDNGVNLKHAITSKLDDLRKVENALIDSGEIQFAKSKAKPQGREAKETNINSLFADDELQMQATKPTKELNLSDEKDFNELSEFFKLNLKDKEFNEIYNKAAATAQKLGVKVKFDESAARSHFVLNDNTITIAAANKEHFQAQDLLHELIHATTRKALKDFSQSPEQAAKIYTKRQIEAIKEINSLYLKSKGIAKRQGKDAYALQNVDEFVAELSSSEFRAFLKAQDIFERFIKALIRFFTGDSERLAKNVNSYKALKESYYKILDDYEPPLAPQKSVLDKNSEPQLAANLPSDEILANSKAKSQGIFKDKTEQDYTNAYFQKLKKENPNLSDDKLLEEANDQAEFVRSSKNDIKLTTRIAKGYPKRDIRTEQELKDIYDEGSYFSLQQRREEIEDFYNITPLKEFGTNYAEFYRDGQGAVKKLLAEKQGQVAGAFYRQDLGDITLAWGKSYKDENGEWRGFGLAHILDKHGKEFKDLARELSEVVEKGVLVKESDDKIILKSPQHTIILGKKENDKFVVTGYRQNNAKKLETTQTGGAGSFADETHPRNSLSSNQQEILPQNELKSQGEKEFLSPNGEDIFAKTTPEQRNQIVKDIQGEIDELVKASYEIDGKIKQIAKVANERAEITGRYSRTSDEIKAIDALNKESEKLEKEVYKLQTLQNFFKGDLSNDFWEFLHNFNNEKALKWYEKEINKRVKSVSGDETQKVSHEVSHINQNNAIMSENSHKGGQDGTSNASNGLNAAEKGMPASEPAGISDGLFSQKQLLDEPRGAGADFSNSPTHRQQPQTLFSQGASEPNASGGQQRGSNERLRTASGDLRGEVSGDGQNLRAEKGLNVSERFGQDRSEQHSRAKHTIRANSGSGASHSNATTTQELVSDTNAAGILSPAEKATIENQKFTQTIDPAKLDDFENVLNVIKENYDNFYENTLENVIGKIPLRYIVYKAEQGNRLAQEILENFSTGCEGRGYSGYSMSNNAVAAYENGQKPLSNFTKEDAEALSELTGKKWTLKEVKDFVKDSGKVGYHHTSKFYNTTNFYSIAEAIKNSDSNIFSDEILKKFNFKDEAKFKAIFEKQKDIDFKLSSARFYLDKLENDLSVDYERLLELKRYKDELEKLSATNYKEYKQLSKMQDDGLFDKAKAENERQIKKEQNATQKLNDKVNEFFEKHPKLRDSYDSFIYKKTDDDILKSFESNVYKVTRGDYEVNELSFGDKILLENLEETLKLRNYFNKKFDNKIDKKELENMIFSYYEKMSEQKIKDNANRYSTKQGLNFLERYKDFKEYIRYYDNLYKTYKENDYAADIYNIESIIKDLRHTLNKKGIDTKDLHIENLMPKQTIQQFKDKDGKITKTTLQTYAAPVPKLRFNNIEQFKKMFQNVFSDDNNKSWAFLATPYKPVKIDLAYAYKHFFKNTNDKNRNFYKEAFFDTFDDPLFIAKNSAKGRDSVYFYKPFYKIVKDKNGNDKEVFLNLFGIGVDSNGKVDFKTFYDDTGSRMNEILNLSDENIVYIKA